MDVEEIVRDIIGGLPSPCRLEGISIVGGDDGLRAEVVEGVSARVDIPVDGEGIYPYRLQFSMYDEKGG